MKNLLDCIPLALFDAVVIRDSKNTEALNWTEFELSEIHIDDDDIRYIHVYRYGNQVNQTVGGGSINIDSFTKKSKVWMQKKHQCTVESFFGPDLLWHSKTNIEDLNISRVGDTELEAVMLAYDSLTSLGYIPEEAS